MDDDGALDRGVHPLPVSEFDEAAVRGLLLVQSTFGEILAFENDHITGQLLSYGAHTRCELAFLMHFVDPGDIVLDAGAHIGTFTIPLAQRVGPAGRLIAIELDPRNYSLLAANIRLTGMTERVIAVQRAIGRPQTTYQFARHPSNTGMSHILAGNDRPSGLAGSTLDEIVGAGTRVAVAKIVIQGMELEALRGAERLLLDDPILYVQVHRETLAQHGASPELLGDFLRARGFRFFINVGERNAAHDAFVVKEIDRLGDHGAHIDVLAIPNGHPRLARAIVPSSDA